MAERSVAPDSTGAWTFPGVPDGADAVADLCGAAASATRAVIGAGRDRVVAAGASSVR